MRAITNRATKCKMLRGAVHSYIFTQNALALLCHIYCYVTFICTILFILLFYLTVILMVLLLTEPSEFFTFSDAM